MWGFRLTWALCAAALLALAAWAGSRAKFKSIPSGTLCGILIDERERYSLNRLQLVVWTMLILSTFLGMLFYALAAGLPIDDALKITTELLGLLGISASTAVVAGAVKDGKNVRRPWAIIGGTGWKERVEPHRPNWATDPLPTSTPRFVQVFLEEEGTGGGTEVVSITKFQNFIFTIALAVIYVVLTCKAMGYPAFDEQVLWLVGISHAGYIGGKIPDKV